MFHKDFITSLEVKRDRATKDEESKGPASKKKPTRAAIPVEGPAIRMHDETWSSTSHPSGAPLTKKKWDERMNKKKMLVCFFS